MTDSSQSCPGFLQLNQTTVGNVCGKMNGTSGICDSALYNSVSTYSQVCGRVKGYRSRFPNAFEGVGGGLNSPYISGLSITHGSV